MDTLSLFLTTANVIFLITNAYILFYDTKMRKKQYTANVTTNYIQRYNNAEMLESKIMIDHFFKQIEDLSEKDKIAKIQELLNSKDIGSIRTKFHVMNLVNLLTELGVAFRAGNVSREVLFTFNAIVPKYWQKLEVFISEDRKLSAPRRVYTSFEYLKNYLEKNPFWKQGQEGLDQKFTR